MNLPNICTHTYRLFAFNPNPSWLGRFFNVVYGLMGSKDEQPNKKYDHISLLLIVCSPVLGFVSVFIIQMNKGTFDLGQQLKLLLQ